MNWKNLLILCWIMVIGSEGLEILKKRLPDAILIGAKKSGTRALLTFISIHPNVSAANPEIHFFDKYYHLGIDWYRSQMPFATQNQIVIEKTPKYLVDPKVAQRVYNMNKNVKLIVILRNPISRAISEFVQTQWKQKRNIFDVEEQARRFNRMLYQNRRGNLTIRKNWSVIRNGIYVKHVKNWLKYFPLESFIFINGDNLVRNPHQEMKKLQEFLAIKPIITERNFVMTTQKRGFPCIRLKPGSDRIKCLNDQKGRPHPKINPSVFQDLDQFYKPFNKEFFELIDQEPFW
ncbi:heparan sulfate glucosamine 3-O-sulfotransferase 6 [Brachionus plicatilis]|uniref:Heparan sulfate glucosamine 3-O-sulfotransferase 6 n=1 Tax=Brachionus plicatilis TaxID=10195 RepID=A0A3M7SF82_BRAPC|nr:heparan sulfate glucosamine 3-O-sulfotransferase 6 [Brachionus plicatilis]